MVEQGIMPEVLMGGACATVTTEGVVRNTGRDPIGVWLTNKGISFFEVQIHPTTHGREYDWNLDCAKERLVRQMALVRLYEIRPDTISGVTHEEIFDDHTKKRRTIVWFNGEGFAPVGLGDAKALKANEELKAKVGELLFNHLWAYINAGRQMRLELEAMLKGSRYITFVHGDHTQVEAAIEEALAKAKAEQSLEQQLEGNQALQQLRELLGDIGHVNPVVGVPVAHRTEPTLSEMNWLDRAVMDQRARLSQS